MSDGRSLAGTALAAETGEAAKGYPDDACISGLGFLESVDAWRFYISQAMRSGTRDFSRGSCSIFPIHRPMPYPSYGGGLGNSQSFVGLHLPAPKRMRQVRD